jgi:hypothetical protein
MDNPFVKLQRLFDSDLDLQLKRLESFMEDYRSGRDRLLEQFLQENPGMSREEYFKGYDPKQREIPRTPESIPGWVERT